MLPRWQITTWLENFGMRGVFGFGRRKHFRRARQNPSSPKRVRGEGILLYLDVQDNLESFTPGIGDVQVDESLVVFIP